MEIVGQELPHSTSSREKDSLTHLQGNYNILATKKQVKNALFFFFITYLGLFLIIEIRWLQTTILERFQGQKKPTKTRGFITQKNQQF